MFYNPVWNDDGIDCLCINVVSAFEISAVNLIVGYEFACSMNRFISCLPVSHREKISSMSVTFPNGRFYDASMANNFILCFNVGHKNVCKSNGHFCAHGCTMAWIWR